MTKSRAPATKNPPRKTSVKDKVEGVLEKIVGTVEGRPGKKVRFSAIFLLKTRSRLEHIYISFSIYIYIYLDRYHYVYL